MIGRIGADSKSAQPGVTPGLLATGHFHPFLPWCEETGVSGFRPDAAFSFLIELHCRMLLKEKAPKKVYYRKQIPLFRLVLKMKLWPSRRGLLHGVRSFEIRGDYGEIVTHCNKRMIVRDSKNSRSARWLRNKWFLGTCPECGVPEWKIEKYRSTFFRRRWGSQLLQEDG